MRDVEMELMPHSETVAMVFERGDNVEMVGGLGSGEIGG